MKFNALVPELSVTDFKKSLFFYVDVLGFKIEYERIRDRFAFLSLGQAQVMIEQINDHWGVGEMQHPFGRGVNFQIEVSDLHPIIAALDKNNIVPFKPVFESIYQAGQNVYRERELLVQDPDGYLLRFSQSF